MLIKEKHSLNGKIVFLHYYQVDCDKFDGPKEIRLKPFYSEIFESYYFENPRWSMENRILLCDSDSVLLMEYEEVPVNDNAAINNELSPRYLVYPIDKHQSTPTFYNNIPPYILDEAEMGITVVVDLLEQKRLFLDEWESVKVIDNEKPAC